VLASEQQVVLSPQTGTNLNIKCDAKRLPVPVAVYYQRRPGGVEKFMKGVGANLKLYGYPGWEKARVMEVLK
jgi:hypothetical protein